MINKAKVIEKKILWNVNISLQPVQKLYFAYMGKKFIELKLIVKLTKKDPNK